MIETGETRTRFQKRKRRKDVRHFLFINEDCKIKKDL